MLTKADEVIGNMVQGRFHLENPLEQFQDTVDWKFDILARKLTKELLLQKKLEVMQSVPVGGNPFWVGELFQRPIGNAWSLVA